MLIETILEDVVMRGGVDLLSRFFIIFLPFLLSALRFLTCDRSKTARSVYLLYLVHIKFYFRLSLYRSHCPLFAIAKDAMHSCWRLLRLVIISTICAVATR
jgi:hypothetical protein